jgi:hypothetical protein
MLALALAGSAIAVAPASSADEFGQCSTISGCRADDSNMDYCTPYAWPSSTGGIFVDAMINLDNQTVMSDTYQATCGPQTDIGGYLNSSPEYPAGLASDTRGISVCTKKLSSKTCDQATLVINLALLPDYTQRRKTLCHEVGHLAGLAHGSTYGGCMVSGASSNITYSTHHVLHINAAYL